MSTTGEKMGAIAAAVAGKAKTKRKSTGSGQGGQGGDGNAPSVNGYDKGELVSALQKAIRRGDEIKALYWASELMASGETYRMWRRLVVIASEDIGMADPDMVTKIFTMKQAHDLAREWNVPFQAVMMLCRSPKNREADDAAYYYEERRKQGWKIPMPPEAIDGHTRIGRSRLYRLADQTGEDFLTVWCREFYYDAALLNGYTPDEFHGTIEEGKEDVWRRALMKFLGIPYETYDLATCPQPRILTGKATADQQAAEMAAMAKRIPNEPVFHDADPNGEPLPKGVMFVDSFTEEGRQYLVDTNEETCTCPAYERSGGGAMCKHLLAAMRRPT